MSGLLNTDAFVFLNIAHPLCAWATYRGALVCPPNEPGFVSVWTAETLRTSSEVRLSRELIFEHVRRTHHENKVSRLRGIFCFLDKSSAEKACSWATGPRSHFRPENLVELSLIEAGHRRDQFDANWVDFATEALNAKSSNFEWAHKYWAGEPCPEGEPVWETLVDGRAIILGTAIRERAYGLIKNHFPDSLMLLEIARQAAWVGSDLGNVCGFLREDGDDVVLDYLQDMREAEDPTFLRKLEELKGSGHPINWADMAPHIAADSFGRTMDLRPFGFRKPKSSLPFVGKPIGGSSGDTMRN